MKEVKSKSRLTLDSFKKNSISNLNSNINTVGGSTSNSDSTLCVRSCYPTSCHIDYCHPNQ